MSRFDDVGLFWQDLPREGARGRVVRPMPPIPETKWERPRSFPSLRNASSIAFDLETYDPELITHGPGWARGKGHVVGLAVCADGERSWYFPVRHETHPEQNFDPADVFAWAAEELGREWQPKLGANLMYDVGWLAESGVTVAGELHDVQFAEALLSEEPRVALELLAQAYCGEGKDSSLLYQWLADWFGGQPGPAQKGNIYRAPPCLAGPYAQSDVELPYRILAKQWPKLEAQALTGIYRMECDLIPLLVAMRFAGVPVDTAKAEEARVVLLSKEQEFAARLRHLVGMEVNVNAADSLAKMFGKLSLPYGRTKPSKAFPQGKPSFTKDFLKTVRHPAVELVQEIRKVAKTRGTFVEGYVLNSNVNGYVFPQFHPLRGDESGARSGRFSSSDPNYQNLPARDEWLGPLVRSLCVPDAALGHTQWRKWDYSQIEYRFFAHFAVGDGADELRWKYGSEPDTDYHEHTLDLVAPVAGWDINTPERRKHWRKPVKNINFGLLYGMGIEHLAEVLGLTVKQAKALFASYHAAVPFTKTTMTATMEEAADVGFITTILGRRSRFDLWEDAAWRGPKQDDVRKPALPYDLAIRAYGSVKRAYLHKALNRRLQGSAADLMKLAMVKAWKDGVFAATGVPRLTVHDELDFSDPQTAESEQGFAELKHTMETVLPLRVPVVVDFDTGTSWGDC